MTHTHTEFAPMLGLRSGDPNHSSVFRLLQYSTIKFLCVKFFNGFSSCLAYVLILHFWHQICHCFIRQKRFTTPCIIHSLTGLPHAEKTAPRQVSSLSWKDIITNPPSTTKMFHKDTTTRFDEQWTQTYVPPKLTNSTESLYYVAGGHGNAYWVTRFFILLVKSTNTLSEHICMYVYGSDVIIV